jgi:hypothetical protein
MEFDEIFEQGNKHRKYDNDKHYGHDDHHQKSNFQGEHNDIKVMILNKLRNNPKLKALLIAASILTIAVIIILIILIFPSIIKLFGFLGENGIQGLLDSIWSGTKK